MSKPTTNVNANVIGRRRVLRGLGGATVGLPLLDVTLRRRDGRAAPTPVYAAFICGMNGVQQAGFGSEPERFWPKALGPLTKAVLEANADRATGELKDHAERLLMLRGVKLPFPGNGCAHSGAGNQLLSAARVSDTPSNNKSLSMRESVDNYMGRLLGREPLALYAGPKGGYINDHISHRGPKDVRIAESNPWLAYMRMIGMAPATTPELAMKIASRRASVNDLVRAELQETLARKDLSQLDRQRLDMHFTNLREIEVKLTRELAPTDVTALRAMDGKHRSNTTRLQVERMQMDLIAFAFASGYTQVGFLQCGDGTDGMTYTVDGVTLTRFHLISHRASSDGAVSDGTMPDAVNQHHQIDRIVMRQWKYFLDKLASVQTPEGSLLDVGYAVWCNHVGTGNHNYHNIPYLIAGKARGYFKTGQYMSASGTVSSSSSGNVTNNKLLNSFINAMGLRKEGGAPIDDFGDPSLPKGLLPGLTA